MLSVKGGTEEMVAQEKSQGSEDGFPFPNLGMTELVHRGEVGGRGREGERGASRCWEAVKEIRPMLVD